MKHVKQDFDLTILIPDRCKKRMKQNETTFTSANLWLIYMFITDNQ
jgi:hypothetical protein